MVKKSKEYVGLKDVKEYLKNGGNKKDIATFMGYATETTIDKWIARRSIPRWQQKRVKEFLLSQEMQALKT